MEATAETFRTRLIDLRAIETKRTDLMEELLHRLEKAEAKLQQTELDLQNERDARRRLQQDVFEMKERESTSGRRPFAVVLIDADADGYIFQDRFITKAMKGGEHAADELLARAREYLRGIMNDSEKLDILVKAFANLEGLAFALVRDGRLKDAGQLRAFVTGFSSRLAFFDFVDVGVGKERADHKIRECMKFYVDSSQCKHIVLGCCHDSGYAPFLGQFVADNSASERITLLEGSPFPPPIKALGFKRITRFQTVFTCQGRHSPPNGTSSSPPSSPSTPTRFYVNNAVQWDRLGPVVVNSAGLRYDRPLLVDKALVERLKKANLCHWLFLRGECVGCARNHVHHLLTDAEFDALWSLARQGRCFKDRKGGNCSDPKCIYGHILGMATI